MSDINFKFLNNVLNKLKRNNNALPFLKPVDPISLGIPDYFEKIKTPMDLSTIKSKLDSQAYKTTDEFASDVKLMFENCYLYNGEESPVSKCGKELQKHFNSLMNETSDKDNLLELINEIEKPKYKKITWPFLNPVTEEEAPNYFTLVKRPMDLSTIKGKIITKSYANNNEVIKDLQLIADNCFLYNNENSEIYSLGKEFESLYKRVFTVKEDEESIESIRKKISELKSKLSVLEKNSTSKIYSIRQRERLGKIILEMSKDESEKVVEIIQRNCSNFQYIGNDEIEINMHTMPDHVLSEIEDFIQRIDKRDIMDAESSSTD